MEIKIQYVLYCFVQSGTRTSENCTCNRAPCSFLLLHTRQCLSVLSCAHYVKISKHRKKTKNVATRSNTCDSQLQVCFRRIAYGNVRRETQQNAGRLHGGLAIKAKLYPLSTSLAVAVHPLLTNSHDHVVYGRGRINDITLVPAALLIAKHDYFS